MSGLSAEEYILLNSISDGITVNSQNVILYVNETFAKMVGYGVPELIGMNVLDVTAPEYVDLINERTHKRQLGLEVVSIYELELVRKDGTRFPVEFNASRIDFEGKSSSLTIIRNISERKRAEETLRESEALFRGFMQSATQMFVMFNEDMHYIEVNNSWLQYVGLERDDVIGRHVLDVFPKLKETGRYDAYLEVMESGNPVEFRAAESASGRGLVLDFSVFKAADRLGVIGRDVSYQVMYRRQLEALNEHATQLATQNTVHEIVAVTFNIIEDMFGYNYGSFGLVEGDTLHHIIIPKVETIDEFSQPIDGPGICPRAVRSGVTQVVNETHDDPDFIIAVSKVAYHPRSELVVPILVEGKVGAILNVESLSPGAFSDNDIRLVELLANHVGSAMNRIIETEKRLRSEQELLEERINRENEQELGQLKTRFMSTATHEIRTPLSSIQGYTELIQLNDDNLSESQREYFDVIQRNVKRLTVLTDDLLDLQRFEEGKMSVSLEPVVIRNLVDSVESEFAPILAEKNQSIKVNCVDVVVNIDRLRVMQVLVNLLSNASKFSPDYNEIVVDIVRTDDGVQISVSDKGLGVSEENLGKLFTPFPGILVDGNVRGTGLGLSICKGIVELHGGTIWAESDGLGKGSKFSFSIPDNFNV